MSKVRKFTMNMPESEIESLRYMSTNQSVPGSMTEVVRRAIVTERFPYEAVQQGDHFLMINPETGVEQEAVFVPHHSPFEKQ